jgi:hypothetical protein
MSVELAAHPLIAREVKLNRGSGSTLLGLSKNALLLGLRAR